MNSLYFCTRTGPTEISGLRRMKLNRPMRRRRAKRSLMSSSVGMRPRTMRSWLAEVVGAHPARLDCRLLLVVLAGDALEQGVDFVLGEKFLAHGRSSRRRLTG